MDVVPFQKKNRSDLIYEKLSELIRAGEWKSGERFPTEMELTRLFNVGRSTVREAVNRLKTSHLVRVVPGRGTFVTEPPFLEPQVLFSHIPDGATARELFNIIEFRICLEPSTAYLAAERITLFQKKKLLSMAGTVENESLSPSEFAETDIAFHIFLAEITGNPLSVEIMNYLHTFFYKQQIVTSLISARKQAAGRSHRAIAKAVSEHKGKTAEKEMRDHLYNTREYLKGIVRETALADKKRKSGGG